MAWIKKTPDNNTPTEMVVTRISKDEVKKLHRLMKSAKLSRYSALRKALVAGMEELSK